MNAHKFVAEHEIEEAKRVLEGAPDEATHFELTIDGVFYFKYEKFDWLCFGDNQLIKTYMEDHELYHLISLKELKQVVESLDMVAKHGGLFYLKCQIEKGGYDFEWYGENGEFGFTELNILEKAIKDYELVESYKGKVVNKKLCYRCLNFAEPVLRKRKAYGDSLYQSCSKCKCFVFWS